MFFAVICSRIQDNENAVFSTHDWHNPTSKGWGNVDILISEIDDPDLRIVAQFYFSIMKARLLKSATSIEALQENKKAILSKKFTTPRWNKLCLVILKRHDSIVGMEQLFTLAFSSYTPEEIFGAKLQRNHDILGDYCIWLATKGEWIRLHNLLTVIADKKFRPPNFSGFRSSKGVPVEDLLKYCLKAHRVIPNIKRDFNEWLNFSLLLHEIAMKSKGAAEIIWSHEGYFFSDLAAVLEYTGNIDLINKLILDMPQKYHNQFSYWFVHRNPFWSRFHEISEKNSIGRSPDLFFDFCLDILGDSFLGKDVYFKQYTGLDDAYNFFNNAIIKKVEPYSLEPEKWQKKAANYFLLRGDISTASHIISGICSLRANNLRRLLRKKISKFKATPIEEFKKDELVKIAIIFFQELITLQEYCPNSWGELFRPNHERRRDGNNLLLLIDSYNVKHIIIEHFSVQPDEHDTEKLFAWAFINDFFQNNSIAIEGYRKILSINPSYSISRSSLILLLLRSKKPIKTIYSNNILYPRPESLFDRFEFFYRECGGELSVRSDRHGLYRPPYDCQVRWVISDELIFRESYKNETLSKLLKNDITHRDGVTLSPSVSEWLINLKALYDAETEIEYNAIASMISLPLKENIVIDSKVRLKIREHVIEQISGHKKF